MKIRFLLAVLVLIILSGSLTAFSQAPGVSGKPMPDSFKKYNLPSLGENVFVFDPSMDMKDIQAVIDTIFARQSARRSEFSLNRVHLLKTGPNCHTRQ